MNTTSKQFLTLVVLIVVVALIAPTAECDDRYVDKLNGTVEDKLTGLVWVKDPSAVPQLISPMAWKEAKDACENLVYADQGPNAWRLPRVNELKTLLDGNFKNPQINSNYFMSESAQFWSATSFQPGARAWIVNFKNGALGAYDKHNPDKPARHFARCVSQPV